MSVPDEIQRVLNARACDALEALGRAIDREDSEATLRAAGDLHEALRDSRAAKEEFTA